MQSAVPEAGVPLRVVVVYEDVPAGLRAVGVLKEVLQDLSGDVELQPVLWRFDLLDDLHWQKMAVNDAAHADILILSTAGSLGLPEAVGRWLEASAARKGDGDTALVVLRGTKEAWTISLQDESVADVFGSVKPVVPPLPAGESLLGMAG